MSEPKLLLRRVGKMKDPTSVVEYEALGGFEGLRRAMSMEKEDILAHLDAALLRGRGGAAYPLGKKWRHLYEAPNFPKYVVCNADEGEPGTFKDKVLLRDDPLSVAEGMIIAGYVFGAQEGYIYIRGEYYNIQKTFEQALAHARSAGFLGNSILGREGFDYDITVISGAGAYVCGENSALLNSVEGRTGRPRVKPPHLADVGLHLQPTLVNNVESLACVPHVILMGGEEYRRLGTEDGGGTKLICLSGHVKNRGVHEIPLGIPFADLIYDSEFGGGIAGGKALGFCHFGGQSGPLGFPEQLENMAYSYDGLWERGLAIGSGAIVVMDDTVDVVRYLETVLEFFVHESCGKCTPCRLGTTRLLEVLQRLNRRKARPDDLERLETLLTHVKSLSACGLGQSVPVPVRSGFQHRRAAFETLLGGAQ